MVAGSTAFAHSKPQFARTAAGKIKSTSQRKQNLPNTAGLSEKMRKAMTGKVSAQIQTKQKGNIILQNKKAVNNASEVNKMLKSQKSGLKINGASSRSPMRGVTGKKKKAPIERPQTVMVNSNEMMMFQNNMKQQMSPSRVQISEGPDFGLDSIAEYNGQSADSQFTYDGGRGQMKNLQNMKKNIMDPHFTSMLEANYSNGDVRGIETRQAKVTNSEIKENFTLSFSNISSGTHGDQHKLVSPLLKSSMLQKNKYSQDQEALKYDQQILNDLMSMGYDESRSN